MPTSFISQAGKKVTDIREFLRESAGGSSIKYMAEKGAKHIIYFPYEDVQETDDAGNTKMVRRLKALSGSVHDWQTPDGKYKSTICIKGFARKENGIDLNNGSCPFCDRVGDAWDIYRYRRDLEDATCLLTGDERKKHMEKANATYADERKAKDARPYMYILIVLYKLGTDKQLVLGTDGLPVFELKVMKLSSSRVEKLEQQIVNSGADLPGSEVLMEYPNIDDRRLQISQSTTAPIFPNNMVISRYPALIAKINEQVEQFTWEGMEKAFPEWNGMTTAEAESTVNGLFEKWDEYKKNLKINPAVKYMEYVSTTAVTNPSLGVMPNGVAGAIPGVVPGAAPVIPGAAPVVPGAAPVIPGAAPVVPGAAPVVPGAAPVVPGAAPVIPGAAPVIPGAANVVPGAAPGTVPGGAAVPNLDIQSVFGGQTGGTITI